MAFCHPFYKKAQWEKLRLWQLRHEPLCRYCYAEGIVTPATVCDHVEPHKGDSGRFFDTGNIQSLCKRCHDSRKQRIEMHGYDRAIGDDGWPVDPNHPANRPRSSA